MRVWSFGLKSLEAYKSQFCKASTPRNYMAGLSRRQRDSGKGRVGNQHLNSGFFTITFNAANLVSSFLTEVIKHM